MSKRIAGFFRTVPAGLPIAGVSVTMRHESSGVAVATGGMWNVPTNPVVTDANGYFEFTTELSPGPITVDGTSGSEAKKRSGKELMQAGEAYIADIPLYGKLVSNGVVSGYLNGLSASTSGTRGVVIATGAHIVEGFIWSIDTTRTLTHDPEAVFTERWDLIVVEQHVGGTFKGRQNLAIVKGVANQTDPTINTDPNIKQVVIHRAKVPNGATTVTLVDLRVYAGPTSFSAQSILTAALADLSVTTAKLAAGAVTDAKVAAGIDAAKLADGTVSNAELQYINSLTSNAQTQLNTITAALAGYQPLDDTLTALAALDGTVGFIAVTALNTFLRRTLTAATGVNAGIVLTNADGVAGNPTIGVTGPVPLASTASYDAITSGSKNITATVGAQPAGFTGATVSLPNDGKTYVCSCRVGARLDITTATWIKITAALGVSGSEVEGVYRGINNVGPDWLSITQQAAFVGSGQTIACRIFAKVDAGTGIIGTSDIELIAIPKL